MIVEIKIMSTIVYGVENLSLGIIEGKTLSNNFLISMINENFETKINYRYQIIHLIMEGA